MTAGMDPRVVRSRAAVREAATMLFLRDGYLATTMEGIAKAAGVAKRTVYNNFPHKEGLFREVVMAATGIAEAFAASVVAELAAPDDLPAALSVLARRLAAMFLDPRIVRLRRLLAGEAHRFPDLAAEYYRAAPGQIVSALAAAFASGALGRPLPPGDAHRAAEHFTFLVLGAGLDRAMFAGRDETPSGPALARAADDGVRVFLAAYSPARRRGPADWR